METYVDLPMVKMNLEEKRNQVKNIRQNNVNHGMNQIFVHMDIVVSICIPINTRNY